MRTGPTGVVRRSPAPGVILTEVMAQIGVVCLGIFLMHDQHTEDVQIAMTSTDIDFYVPVFPSETVTVTVLLITVPQPSSEVATRR